MAESGAKRQLEQVRNMKRQMDIKLEQLKQLEEMTRRVTASYGGEKVSKTPSRSPMEDAILRLEEEERALKAYIHRMMDLRKEVSGQIERVENVNFRDLLEMRYLNGYSLGYGRAYHGNQQRQRLQAAPLRAAGLRKNLWGGHGTWTG